MNVQTDTQFNKGFAQRIFSVLVSRLQFLNGQKLLHENGHFLHKSYMINQFMNKRAKLESNGR
jgi:hypothetical protein